jgi:radical SAM superfamily enzyme YgiQ (UPF0313 family)
MIDLLLVNPGNSEKMYQSLASPFRSIEPPWWAGILATYVRKHGYAVEIIDADCDNMNTDETTRQILGYKPRLIAVIVQGSTPSASSTPKMSAVRDLLNNLHDSYNSAKTILVGLHPSALPERTLKEEKADYVAIGEGFHTLIDMLVSIKMFNGGIKEDLVRGLAYRSGDKVLFTKKADLLPGEDLPQVAWDLINPRKYRAPTWPCLSDPGNRSPHAIIYTSLGCFSNCDFCQIKCLYNNKVGIRFRPVSHVINEIDMLVNAYGVKHLRIVDELFTTTETRVIEVCDAIIERKYDLNMWQYARTDRVTPKMLEKMMASGQKWVGYGIESATDKSLGSVHKRNSVAKNEQAIKWAREVGMYVFGNVIFGLPEDDMESMNEDLKMMKRHLFEYVNLYCCTAYPGSGLYETTLRDHPDWLPDSWDGYSQLGYETKPLPTNYLTSEEVLQFRDGAFNDYLSYKPYQDMMRKKFGDKAVPFINNMLKYKLKRRILRKLR